jgi:hypothetical protein
MGTRAWGFLLPLMAAAVAGATGSAAGTDNPISFAAPVTYQVAGLEPLTAQDFDGDGHVDIAEIGGGQISFLYGRGDGTFEPLVPVPTPNRRFTQVLGADMDGDHKLDVLLADTDGNTVDLYRNLGERQFGEPLALPVGAQPFGVVAVDLNEDGALDLAVSNNLQGGPGGFNICVLLNRGHGTFGDAVFYPAGSYPSRVAAADFDHDGHQDLAVGAYTDGTVCLYWGDGTGALSGPVAFSTGGSYPAQVVPGDFNGDGRLDIAAANTFSHTIGILLGDGARGFSAPGVYPGRTYPHIMQAADLDGDGDLDLAMPNNGTDYFTVQENQGAGLFSQDPVSFTTGGSNVRSVAIGDFNEDGRPDVAAGAENTATVSVHLNTTLFPDRRLRGTLTHRAETIKLLSKEVVHREVRVAFRGLRMKVVDGAAAGVRGSWTAEVRFHRVEYLGHGTVRITKWVATGNGPLNGATQSLALRFDPERTRASYSLAAGRLKGTEEVRFLGAPPVRRKLRSPYTFSGSENGLKPLTAAGLDDLLYRAVGRDKIVRAEKWQVHLH